MKVKKSDTKKVFLKKGTCSRTFFYILNREFGNLKEEEERASDPLAGGLAQEGYQCGMLWGAALAVGAESFRRYENHGEAIAHAISATQSILESFINRAKSANCGVITNCDFNGKFGLAKFLITGKPLICFNLADKWAPEAIQSANRGLSQQPTDLPELPISCASEVVKKMGGSNEEMVMVAGFAGGIGLSGNACGALGAAVWMKSRAWFKENPNSDNFYNPYAKAALKAFYKETNSEILCSKICGRNFK